MNSSASCVWPGYGYSIRTNLDRFASIERRLSKRKTFAFKGCTMLRYAYAEKYDQEGGYIAEDKARFRRDGEDYVAWLNSLPSRRDGPCLRTSSFAPISSLHLHSSRPRSFRWKQIQSQQEGACEVVGWQYVVTRRRRFGKENCLRKFTSSKLSDRFSNRTVCNAFNVRSSYLNKP
jgi:hypothetical protein